MQSAAPAKTAPGALEPPVACQACGLRRLAAFRKLSPGELQFVSGMKRAQVTFKRGEVLLREGAGNGTLYTLYDGWAARVRRMPTGARQILEILLPGDQIGVSASLLGQVNHSVVALTSVTLCVLDAHRIGNLFEEQPTLALSMLQCRALEQERSDNRVTMLGRLSASQRVGYFLLELRERLEERDLTDGPSCPYPLRHSQLSETVGLSLAQVMRALSELKEQGLAQITKRRLEIPNVQRLARFSQYRSAPSEVKQPLL